jgi:putative nucleotidyltransferase with HDIG domain
MLNTNKIEVDLLARMELPALPGYALRIAALAQDTNTSTRQMVDAIGCDPVLAARVLRAANSPLYALERSVTSLPMAVNALGNHAIHMLVVVYAALDSFNAKGKRSELERELWEHSLTVGVAARELCVGLGMRGSEEAFLCGLLHDIGKLLLIRHDAEGYARVEQGAEALKMLACEEELFGCHHARVGALVARHWSLPHEICFVIQDHHRPGETDSFMFMAHVVNVADELTNAAGIGLRREATPDLAACDSVTALRLADEQLKTLWARTEERRHEIMRLFN